MPRGGHKVKPVKAVQAEASVPADTPSIRPAITKIRLAQGFLSRTSAATKGLPESIPEQPTTPQDTSDDLAPRLFLLKHSATFPPDLKDDQSQDATPDTLVAERRPSIQPAIQDTTIESSKEVQAEREQDDSTTGAGAEAFDTLRSDSVASLPSFSKSSASIYSRASSIHSSASSVYSSEVSVHSSEDGCQDDWDRFCRQDSMDDISLDSRLPNGLPYNQLARPMGPRRLDSQESAARQRSTLAKKAALFKNSRLSPQLPLFHTSIPTWSMVCRAAKASQDCYDSQAATRRGIYTAADTSKHIKAMIVDDQIVDDSRLIIVAIRGSQSQSLKDWNVNTAANPTKPIGFLDEEENACHAGFLQVAKAMVPQIATQLQQHPALSQCPTLLFTGHSAGGAIAAMLYSHMLSTSTSAQSELTALTNQFSSISCLTFGAPPVSQTPLLRREHMPGVFLAFANEGDLVLRTSNAAYFKSLAKLMTASPPPSTAVAVAPPPTVKVVRGSRGAAVYRQPVAIAPPTPWEELPLWPTPAPSLTNAGELVLLRDRENGNAIASPITSEDLKDVIFGDLAQHTVEMYLRRVKDLTLTAMFGREL